MAVIAGSTANVLRRARFLINGESWKKGSASFDAGCTCAALAIAWGASILHTYPGAAFRALAAVVGADCAAVGPFSENGLIEKWNDDPARTLDEVLAAFDRAIAAAEARSC